MGKEFKLSFRKKLDDDLYKVQFGVYIPTNTLSITISLKDERNGTQKQHNEIKINLDLETETTPVGTGRVTGPRKTTRNRTKGVLKEITPNPAPDDKPPYILMQFEFPSTIKGVDTWHKEPMKIPLNEALMNKNADGTCNFKGKLIIECPEAEAKSEEFPYSWITMSKVDKLEAFLKWQTMDEAFEKGHTQSRNGLIYAEPYTRYNKTRLRFENDTRGMDYVSNDGVKKVSVTGSRSHGSVCSPLVSNFLGYWFNYNNFFTFTAGYDKDSIASENIGTYKPSGNPVNGYGFFLERKKPPKKGLKWSWSELYEQELTSAKPGDIYVCGSPGHCWFLIKAAAGIFNIQKKYIFNDVKNDENCDEGIYKIQASGPGQQPLILSGLVIAGNSIPFYENGYKNSLIKSRDKKIAELNNINKKIDDINSKLGSASEKDRARFQKALANLTKDRDKVQNEIDGLNAQIESTEYDDMMNEIKKTERVIQQKEIDKTTARDDHVKESIDHEITELKKHKADIEKRCAARYKKVHVNTLREEIRSILKINDKGEYIGSTDGGKNEYHWGKGCLTGLSNKQIYDDINEQLILLEEGAKENTRSGKEVEIRAVHLFNCTPLLWMNGGLFQGKKNEIFSAQTKYDFENKVEKSYTKQTGSFEVWKVKDNILDDKKGIIIDDKLGEFLKKHKLKLIIDLKTHGCSPIVNVEEANDK